jgi:hypothetical protein
MVLIDGVKPDLNRVNFPSRSGRVILGPIGLLGLMAQPRAPVRAVSRI